MSHIAMGRIFAFCSYAHEDERHLADLEAALAPLRDEAIIDGWSDSAIGAGERWDDAIKGALGRAHLVLFVVTPHLLRSEYVNEQEIPLSLARMEARKCEVVPILTVRPDDESRWRANQLAELQPLPRVDRWISDYTDPVSAYKLVCLGVRDACARIGGGDNPYRRADLGDWRHCLQRCEFPDGQWAEWEFTEELIEKTEAEALVLVQTTQHGSVIEKRITYDLTKSLQSQAKDIANQAGVDLTQAETMSMSAAAGGAQISEEILAIGLNAYETRVQSITTQSELNGLTMETHTKSWRSIDVPFDGGVKVRQELSWSNGARGDRTLKMLGFGFGDAASRKPVPTIRNPLTRDAATALGLTLPDEPGATAAANSTPVNTMSGGTAERSDPLSRLKGAFDELVSGFKEGLQQQSSPPPQWRIFPGRWTLQTNDAVGSLAYDVYLYPNGQLQGVCWQDSVQFGLQGGWGFDPRSATLRFDLNAFAQGHPPSQYRVAFRIVGSDATAFHAHDANGRPFRIWLINP